MGRISNELGGGPRIETIWIGRVAILLRSAALLICAAVVGCKCHTAASIQGDTTPVFSLSGNGALSALTISGPQHQSKTEPMDGGEFLYWEIDSTGGSLDAKYFDEVGAVTYGKVPAAYRQVFPVPPDEVPLALVEGETYILRVHTLGLYANDVAKHFTIREGKPVDVPGN